MIYTCPKCKIKKKEEKKITPSQKNQDWNNAIIQTTSALVWACTVRLYKNLNPEVGNMLPPSVDSGTNHLEG
jgi:hypothetical protein